MFGEDWAMVETGKKKAMRINILKFDAFEKWIFLGMLQIYSQQLVPVFVVSWFTTLLSDTGATFNWFNRNRMLLEPEKGIIIYEVAVSHWLKILLCAIVSTFSVNV